MKPNGLKFDDKNANRGTERGRELVRKSLQKYGAGRSILVDKNGKVIAGNKTLEQAIAEGIEIEMVKSDGKRLIVHQRTDLDLDKDPAARELAIADNRTSEIGLDWDFDELRAMSESFLEDFDFSFEEFDPNEHWQGMPEFEQENKTGFKSIVIHFETENDMLNFSKLIEQTITEQTKSLWYPKKEKANLKEMAFVDES